MLRFFWFQVLRRNTETLQEVAVAKQILVKKKKPFSVKLFNTKGDWIVEQGELEQVLIEMILFPG